MPLQFIAIPIQYSPLMHRQYSSYLYLTKMVTQGNITKGYALIIHCGELRNVSHYSS